MDDNLIRDIGSAESRAAQIVSSAREQASLRLKKTEEELAAREERREIDFAEKKMATLEKARIEGEREAEYIVEKSTQQAADIEKEGMKRKEEVIVFLINKILE